MPVDLSKCYSAVLALVKEAGNLIRDRIWAQKSFQLKSSDVDLVTETDQQVEKLLIGGLLEQFPDHKFIGEESVAEGQHCELTDAPTWIIDPVDGTMNFVHGFPHTCISIALLVDKTAEIAVIYNPVLEQLFTARRNSGAFLNETPIHVSDIKNLSTALLMVEMGTSRDKEKIEVVMKNLQELTPLAHGIRTLGSAALNMAMVAMGAADAYFEFGTHSWDVAAGCLIVREAGGVCIDPDGGPFDLMSRRVLCASSVDLTKEISSKLIQYYPEPRD